jgi:hypothetical protein
LNGIVDAVKKTLRILAGVTAAVTVGFWAGAGANRGLTKNLAEVRTLDPVTGIEGITYVKQFAPGVDFLVAGLAASGLALGVSMFYKRGGRRT